jgi:uracil-DNA glycosylase family protein
MPAGSLSRQEYPGAEPWVPEDHSIPALEAAAPSCRGCELYRDATQVVMGRGDPRSDLMLVGEQPGDMEDRQGKPFVGPAGRLLVGALQEAGIDPGRAYVTNAVKHFRFTTKGKQRIHATPSRWNVTACGPWLLAEFDAVRPQLVVVLGATAGQAVFGQTVVGWNGSCDWARKQRSNWETIRGMPCGCDSECRTPARGRPASTSRARTACSRMPTGSCGWRIRA